MLLSLKDKINILYDKSEKYSGNLILSLTFSIMLFLSMPGNFGIMIFFTFIPVFYFINGKSAKEAFFTGAFSGFLAGVIIYRGFTGYGNIIYYYSILLLSVEFGLFFTLFAVRGFYASALFVPVFEFLRTLGPFACPSNIALSVYRIPSLVFFSGAGGIYLVSFIILSVNFLLFSIKKNYRVLIILVIILLIPEFFFRYVPEGRKLSISVIQGSIPIWMYSIEEFSPRHSEQIEKVYISLTEKAARDSDIVIWPETAIHKFILRKDRPYFREFFNSLSQRFDTDFIVGTSHLEDNNETNSVFLLKNGKEYRYDKIRTVPFVEDFYTKGKNSEPVGDHDYRFAPVICFESVFDSLVIRNTGENADFIVVNTNDAGFNNTIISYLHAAYSVFRACENGRWLVRSAQSGISMFISPDGRITAETESFRTEIFTSEIYPDSSSGLTLFSKYYYIIIVMLFILFIMSLLL